MKPQLKLYSLIGCTCMIFHRSPSHLTTSHRDEEHSVALNTAIRRRAQALVLFAGNGLQGLPSSKISPSASDALSELVSQLVQLAMLQSGPTPDSNVDHISKAAQFAMSQALGSMQAVDFVNAVLAMVLSGNVQVSRGNEALVTWN